MCYARYFFMIKSLTINRDNVLRTILTSCFHLPATPNLLIYLLLDNGNTFLSFFEKCREKSQHSNSSQKHGYDEDDFARIT